MKLLSIFFMMILMGCSRFPYSDVIKESREYIIESHPEYLRSIKYKSEKIYYVTNSNRTKPILLLVHGSPGGWDTFAHLYKDEKLLGDFEVITFDRFGFGKNRHGVPHKSLEDQIIPAKVILEKLKNNRKVIALGHSYGGPVVMKLAFEHPELVDGLILAAASMDPKLEKMKWYQYVAEVWPIKDIIPDFIDVTNREILGLKDELNKMEPSYKEFNKPLRVIQGEADILVPKENVRYIEKHTHIKRDAIILIKNAKHFLPWAFPETLKEVARDLYLKELK